MKKLHVVMRSVGEYESTETVEAVFDSLKCAQVYVEAMTNDHEMISEIRYRGDESRQPDDERVMLSDEDRQRLVRHGYSDHIEEGRFISEWFSPRHTQFYISEAPLNPPTIEAAA